MILRDGEVPPALTAEQRSEAFAEHFGFIEASARRQELLLSGPFGQPKDVDDMRGLFVFDARPVVRNWPARIRVPIGDGKFQTHEIRVDLDYVDMDAYQDLQKAITDFAASGGKLGDPIADPLYKHLKGWSGIAAQGKGAFGYSDAAKSQLLRDPRIRGAVMEATARMVLGI